MSIYITIDELNKIDPIRIVGLENSYLEDPKITLNVFHDHQVLLKEWYLLSGDEYIDLEKIFLTTPQTFLLRFLSIGIMLV